MWLLVRQDGQGRSDESASAHAGPPAFQLEVIAVDELKAIHLEENPADSRDRLEGLRTSRETLALRLLRGPDAGSGCRRSDAGSGCYEAPMRPRRGSWP